MPESGAHMSGGMLVRDCIMNPIAYLQRLQFRDTPSLPPPPHAWQVLAWSHEPYWLLQKRRMQVCGADKEQ